MKGILRMIEYDLRMFFRYKWWLVGMISMNLSDLFIMAIVYTKMVDPKITAGFRDYYSFFSPGITITALFAAAFMIGREINMEVRRELHHYMLSLPMTRLELAVGRVLSGGVRGMIYMAPLLLMNFAFLGFPSVEKLLIILLMLFLLSTGTAGLSITIAVSTKSFEKFVTARGVVYYALFFCSTVFYPLYSPEIQKAIPSMLVTIAMINPLSSGADLIRSYLLNSPPFNIDMIRNIMIFSIIFAVTATLAYKVIIER